MNLTQIPMARLANAGEQQRALGLAAEWPIRLAHTQGHASQVAQLKQLARMMDRRAQEDRQREADKD